MVRFNAALDEETNGDLRDFVVLGLSTGQRRGNVLGMRWEHIAPDLSTWTIPKTKTKNKKIHACELQPAAIRVLKSRKENRKEDNPWVLPSTLHFFEVARCRSLAWKLLVKRAGLYTPGDPDRIT